MRPKIGIIGRYATSVPILRFAGVVVAEALCDAVWDGGGNPLVHPVPPYESEYSLDSRLDGVDGLLLPGGADIDPQTYGQERLPSTDVPVPRQDAFEIAVASFAVQRDIPTLAVCRGMQALNIALGGTLSQKIDEFDVPHYNSKHDVNVEPGSRLGELLGTQRISVSSYHHQAIERLGRGLVPTAFADDGVIEAVETTTADVLAVQWHPEDLHTTSIADAALFRDLVQRANQRKELTNAGTHPARAAH